MVSVLFKSNFRVQILPAPSLLLLRQFMMKFDDLPDHVISNVFSNLTESEVKAIMPYLSPATNLLAIETLYRDRIILVNHTLHGNDPIIDIQTLKSLLDRQPFRSCPTKYLKIQLDDPRHDDVGLIVNELFKKYPLYF